MPSISMTDDVIYGGGSSIQGAVSRVEDWEALAKAFLRYQELCTGQTQTSYYAGTSHYEGSLESFRKIVKNIVDCAQENDCGSYFEEQEITKKDIEYIGRISSDMAEICRTMHQDVMQSVDNHVLSYLEAIYESTNYVNEGDNVYTLGTHKEAQPQYTGYGQTGTVYKDVPSDLNYYLNTENDSDLKAMYEAYEADYIKQQEVFKPENYKDVIEKLSDRKVSLYVGEIGAYNKMLDEDSFANYIDEIVLGIAVVVGLGITIYTMGTAGVFITNAIGAGMSNFAAAAITTVVGAGAGYLGGYIAGGTIGTIGYYMNTLMGDGTYALDGTYLTKENEALFNKYVVQSAQIGAMSGALVGASTVWVVETAIDAFDFIQAALGGNGLDIGLSAAALFMTGDDIFKQFKRLDDIGDATKYMFRNIDDFSKELLEKNRYTQITLKNGMLKVEKLKY